MLYFGCSPYLHAKWLMEPAQETTMKSPFRWKNLVRGMSLVAVVLGLCWSAMGLGDGSTVAVQATAAPIQMPQGITVASAHTAWHNVLASSN